MSELTLHGFPRSTYVHIARMVLAFKNVPYRFIDSEPIMGTEQHLALHPFGRIPVLVDGDLRIYETSAIALYIDENFPGPSLQPKAVADRALMHQWISAVNDYYYPRIVFNFVHERVVFPELGIASDERVIAKAIPKIVQALDVLERHLADGRRYLVGDTLTLADLFLLPSIAALDYVDEGRSLLSQCPQTLRWFAAMAAHPTIAAYRAGLPPRAPKIEHARAWATEHRASA